jgi:hypothetical protein
LSEVPILPPPGLTAGEIRQGSNGTCWFLAALSAIARVYPEPLQDLIHPLSGDRWRVRMWIPEGGRTETVIPAPPGGCRREILELALGKFMDLRGGAPLKLGFQVLTGRPGRSLDVTPESGPTVWNALVRAAVARSPMTACSAEFAAREHAELNSTHAYELVEPTGASRQERVLLRARTASSSRCPSRASSACSCRSACWIAHPLRPCHPA